MDSAMGLPNFKPEQYIFATFFSFIDSSSAKVENCDEISKEERGEYFEREAEEFKEEGEKSDLKLEVKHKVYQKKLKNFQCSDCDFSSNNIRSLENHKQCVHNGVVRFYCSLCEHKSYFRHNVKHHIRAKHDGVEATVLKVDTHKGQSNKERGDSLLNTNMSKNFKCKDCDFETNFRQSYTNHMASKHENVKTFACNICGKKSYYKQAIARHQKLHKNESCRVLRIGCVKCEGKEEHTRCWGPSLRRPGRKAIVKKKRKYSCNSCDFSQDRKRLLRIHVESVHIGILNFFCKYCPYKSYRKGSLRNHLKRVHKDSSSPILRIGCSKCENFEVHECKKIKSLNYGKFQCNECSYSCDLKLTLVRHTESVHRKIVKFMCRNCAYKSYYKYHMTDHMKRHEEFSGQPLRIGCEKCENHVEHRCRRSISRISSKKKQHQNKLRKDDRREVVQEKIRKSKEFNCNDCKKSFFTEDRLNRHLVTPMHQGIVRFSCSQCDFKAFYSKRVKEHQDSSHEGGSCKVLRIGCTECETDVDGRHNCVKSLKKKMRKFKCEDCNFAINKRRRLITHKQSVHLNIVKYYCHSCDFKSYFRYKVQTHQVLNHPEYNGSVKRIGCLKCFENEDHECVKKLRKGKFNCKECNFSTTTKQLLSNHVENVHLKVKQFYCELCEYKSYYRHNIQTHKTFKHKGIECKVKRFDCLDCTQNRSHTCKRPRGRVSRRNNSVVQEAVTNLKCEQCDFTTEIKQNLKIHTEKVHLNLKRYACSGCDWKSYFRTSFESHCETHHRDDPEAVRVLGVGCTKCEKSRPHQRCTFVRGDQRSGRFRKERDESIECSLCEDRPSFYNQRLRSQHFRETHPGQHIFTCTHCQYGTNYLPNLNTHTRSQHDKARLQCDRCDWSTSWNQSFHKHMREKHGHFQKKSKHFADSQHFLCDRCAFSTFSKVEFERHKTSPHDGSQEVARVVLTTNKKSGRPFIAPAMPRNFRCNKCEYSTDLSGNLKAHISQVHEGIKFPCDHCNYKATARHNLKIHIENVHNGIRYNCPHCNHLSTTKANLKVHISSVHEKDVRFQCQKCSYKTFQMGNLKQHIQIKHPKKSA